MVALPTQRRGSIPDCAIEAVSRAYLKGASTMTTPEYRVISRNSSTQEIQEVLPEILQIQSSWIISRETVAPKNGFLISSFSPEELSSLIQKDGMLVCAFRESEILGYCLTTPILEFTSLYEDSSEGDFHPSASQSISDSTHRYLYQIATTPSQIGLGVGQGLIEITQVASRGFALLTDVLTAPIENTASRRFFRKNGFKPIGELTLKSYRNFGELKSEVLQYN
jgi:ribosomal protein S18 acetylase RimI-like enzyme